MSVDEDRECVGAGGGGWGRGGERVGWGLTEEEEAVVVCACVRRGLREGRASQEELQAASTGQEFRMLDEVFSAFDSAVESYGMFKYQHVRWRPRRSKHRVL